MKRSRPSHFNLVATVFFSHTQRIIPAVLQLNDEASSNSGNRFSIPAAALVLGVLLVPLGISKMLELL